MIKITYITEMILLLLLKFLFDASYILYVHPNFEYMGFGLEFFIYKWIISNLALITLYLLMKKKEKDYSDIFLKILLIIMIIPMLSLYGMKSVSTEYLVYFVVSFAITLLIVKLPNIIIWPVRINLGVLYSFLGLIIIGVFMNLAFYNGLPSLTALNLLKVYEVRASTNYGPFIMGYLIPWLAKVINPFLIGLFFYKRKFKWMAFFCIIQFILYLYTGHKSYILSPLIIISFMNFIQTKKVFIKATISVFLVVLCSLCLYLLEIEDILASLFIRRTFFVTAQNSYYYYDFFSQTEFIKLSHSIFESIYTYPYSIPVANVIGGVFYNDVSTWVNTGYLGDAYMNFGFLGMIIFSVFFAFILKIIDSIDSPLSVKFAALFIPMFSLISGALLTSLLTGGIIIGILIIYIYSNIDNKY